VLVGPEGYAGHEFELWCVAFAGQMGRTVITFFDSEGNKDNSLPLTTAAVQLEAKNTNRRNMFGLVMMT